jgi:hypothetical protein
MPGLPPLGLPALPETLPPVEGEPPTELLPAAAPAAPPVPAPPPPSSVGASEHAKLQKPEKTPAKAKRVMYADIFIATPRAKGAPAEVRAVFV